MPWMKIFIPISCTNCADSNPTLNSNKRQQYFLFIKKLTDELAVAGQPMSCEDVITYVLAGLGHEYDSFVASILARTGKVIMEDIYSLLLATEARLSRHQFVISHSTYLCQCCPTTIQLISKSWQRITWGRSIIKAISLMDSTNSHLSLAVRKLSLPFVFLIIIGIVILDMHPHQLSIKSSHSSMLQSSPIKSIQCALHVKWQKVMTCHLSLLPMFLLILLI
ncbi:hypothetical protein Patl1_26491 [Pistacia atlantica]|uniref:Uncharacterized protein n=1 Tax=Pistacia atlantica TaxID=434234 RepID=A0ACC1AZZ4_9ROSI|nr:hypothetical protein Patl1_26491 [Pistacia atlantica]